MEGQITLTEWMQWREDIRRKLQETAGNFVYIGYRLKQIRDSGMYDGCEDIFEFAQKEYGLSKSITSRFIAINEKFSESGNSLEIREEFKNLGSSKLSEMLTLSEEDCFLITEKTTVKEIRELKHFNKEEIPAEPSPVEIASEDVVKEDLSQDLTMATVQYTPLQKCIIDFFKTRKDVAEAVMNLLNNDWQVEEASKVINPGEHITHKKGIVFLFMYDYKSGVAYKQMGHSEPVKMSWDEFLNEFAKVYEVTSQSENFDTIWDKIYPPESKGKIASKMPENRENTPVATSQQNIENAEKIPSKVTKEVLGNEGKETEESHFVEVNKMVSEDHSSEAGEMVEAEQNAGADKKIMDDHAVEITEMVTEKHLPEAIKLTEEESEVIPPPRRATEWRSQVNRCLSNLQIEIKSDAWEAAKTTLRKMEHYIDLVVRTEL